MVKETEIVSYADTERPLKIYEGKSNIHGRGYTFVFVFLISGKIHTKLFTVASSGVMRM